MGPLLYGPVVEGQVRVPGRVAAYARWDRSTGPDGGMSAALSLHTVPCAIHRNSWVSGLPLAIARKGKTW